MKKLPMSYSAVNRYNTCPQQFYRLSVVKDIREDGNKEHLLWGNEVHKALELAVGKGTPLPENMQMFQRWVDVTGYMGGDKHVELSLAINADLDPVSFWDKDVWLRGKIDLVVDRKDKGVVWDWKTGKVKPDMLQLEMSALLVMCNYMQFQRVHAAFIYLKFGEDVDKVYLREDIPSILATIRKYEAEYNWSYENNEWPCKRSGLCNGWCPVIDCEHWSERR